MAVTNSSNNRNMIEPRAVVDRAGRAADGRNANTRTSDINIMPTVSQNQGKPTGVPLMETSNQNQKNTGLAVAGNPYAREMVQLGPSSGGKGGQSAPRPEPSMGGKGGRPAPPPMQSGGAGGKNGQPAPMPPQQMGPSTGGKGGQPPPPMSGQGGTPLLNPPTQNNMISNPYGPRTMQTGQGMGGKNGQPAPPQFPSYSRGPSTGGKNGGGGGGK